MKFIFLILMICFAHSVVRADNCSDVHLNAPGKAFAKIPTYNQAKYAPWVDSNICYAVAAAELRDAARFAKGDPLDKISSPISVGLNFKAHILDQNYDKQSLGIGKDDGKQLGSGSPLGALYLNNNRDVCDQRWLEGLVSIIDANKRGPRVSVDDFIFNLTYQFLQQQRGYPDDPSSKFNVPNIALIDHFNCRKSDVGSVTELMNQINTAVASDATLGDKIGISQLALTALCKGHAVQDQFPAPITTWLRSGSEAELRAELDKNLNVENPIGIGYCHESLKEDVSCGASHASVVIGRKMNRGRCEYLVRDSYGVRCDSRFLCEKDGSIWVPASELAKTVKLTYVIPK